MISLDLSVSGDQLGRALADDPEELFYALEAMAEGLSDRDIAKMAEYGRTVCEDVIVLLEKMAAALKGETA